MTHRGYPESKISENIQAEIMEVVAEEARASYDHSILLELVNNTPEQLEESIETIANWVAQCRAM